jgi:hypothetical protein
MRYKKNWTEECSPSARDSSIVEYTLQADTSTQTGSKRIHNHKEIC